MTTISAHRAVTLATPFERTLLRMAATLDQFVAARLVRRCGPAHRRVVDARAAFAARRRTAEAAGAIGLLPR